MPTGIVHNDTTKIQKDFKIKRNTFYIWNYLIERDQNVDGWQSRFSILFYGNARKYMLTNYTSLTQVSRILGRRTAPGFAQVSEQRIFIENSSLQIEQTRIPVHLSETESVWLRTLIIGFYGIILQFLGLLLHFSELFLAHTLEVNKKRHLIF